MDAVLLARRAGSAAVMVALLAAAMGLYSLHLEGYDRMYAPLSSSGSVGQAVTSGPFSVRVDKVTVAASVSQGAYGGYGPPLRPAPSAVFVLVDGRVRAQTEATKLPTAYLESGGTHYAMSDKGTQKSFTDVIAEPGYWITGTWLFEVPKDKLPGARLVVSPRPTDDYPAPVRTFPHYGFELTPQVDVDLGLTGAKAQEALTHPAQKAPYKEPAQ